MSSIYLITFSPCITLRNGSYLLALRAYPYRFCLVDTAPGNNKKERYRVEHYTNKKPSEQEVVLIVVLNSGLE